MKTGGVRIVGPMTKEEKPYWDELRKEDNDEEIAELEKILSEEQDHARREMLLLDLEHARKIRALIAKVIPD